jgi:predicted GNAT superfamily acetyltransferase
MGNSIREFLILTKKLLVEVRTLNFNFLRLQEKVESVAKEQRTQNQRQQTPPILRAELQIPEAIDNKREPDKRKKVRREWYAIILSALTLAAVTGYAIITYQMWRQPFASA